MIGHTSGPWKVVQSWYDFMVEGPDGQEIIWQDGPYDTPTIKEANARLIAAAPEMLEVLNAWLDQYKDEEYKDCPEVVQTRAAIAKATGQ